MLIHTSVRLPDVKSQAKNGEINKKVEHKHVCFRDTLEGTSLIRTILAILARNPYAPCTQRLNNLKTHRSFFFYG